MMSPVIVAAVDIDNAETGVMEKLRKTMPRIMLTEPGARLACVSVTRIAGIAVETGSTRMAAAATWGRRLARR